MPTPRADDPGFLVLRGRGTSPGLACGPLRRNRVDLAAKEVEGAVLVAERAVPDDVGRILSSAGTVTISGAVLSHVSLLSREFGKPAIALSSGSRARILPEGEGLLLLEDVVGSERPPVLLEGDVVLLDGDEGTIRVPGGLDPEERRSVRAVHPPLLAYARLPDDPSLLAALVHACGDPGGPAFAYALEAALFHRLVPSGEPARRLIAALSEGSGRAKAIAKRLGGLRERLSGRTEARCDRALEAVEGTEDLDELDRTLRDLERSLERELAVFEDVGMTPDPVEHRLEAVVASVDARRAVLRKRIEEEVAEALVLPEELMRPRLGGLFRLLRRARAASVAEPSVVELQARLSRLLAEERARAGIHLAVPLAEDSPRERNLIGGKAAGLLEVRRVLPEECRVPRGFVVTASSYRLHLLGETGEKLRQAILDGGDEARLSRRCRAAILSGAVPDEVHDAIAAAYAELGEPRVAVRSSATIEDAPLASLAGLFDTYLGVRGLPDLLDRVRWAWASLWNARALATLNAAGMSPLRAAQAVLVQEVVETRSAGVLFSRDPAGRPDTLLVNACWGLGEAISQGEIAGDLYWVRRSTGEVVASEPGSAERRIVLDPSGSGTLEVPVPAELRGKPCLSPEDLSRLAKLAQSLEAATGRAQDVEFGFDDGGDLVVFQIRRVVPARP